MTKLKDCLVCGQPLGEADKQVECSNCHTVYDLVNKKVDNSKTQIEPADCRHRRRKLIQGSSGDGQNETVTVCPDCGEIKIFGTTWPDRKRFELRIVMWSQEIVNAIGKAAKLIPDQPGF